MLNCLISVRSLYAFSAPVHHHRTTTNWQTCLIDYRGHWCPFCLSYIKNLQALKESILHANGKAVIVTAESGTHLAETRSKTGYDGEAIVDPENLLAAALKERGMLSVAISDKSGYPHGMAQPAVLVLKSDSTVLYQWAIIPSLVRPIPQEWTVQLLKSD